MLLSRTSSLQYYGYSQILRFFHEGIYGRYFEENRLIGNGMNVHEGLQLMSSTAAVIVICLGILKPRSLWEKFGAALFVSLFIPLIAELNIGRDTPLYSSVALTMVFWAGIICVGIGFSLLERYRLQYTPNRLPSDRTSEMISAIVSFGDTVRPGAWWQAFAAAGLSVLIVIAVPGLRFHSNIQSYSGFYVFLTLSGVLIYLVDRYFAASSGPLKPAKSRDRLPHPRDTTFHLFATVALLFSIVTVDGYRIVWRLFNRADFTHSRLSTVLVFSLC